MNFKKKNSSQIGRAFESNFKSIMLSANYNVIRIPDGIRVYSKSRDSKFARVKSPFDFILCRDGESIFVDCKVCSIKSFSISRIPLHQLESLKDASYGGLSGLAIYFTIKNSVYFFHIGMISRIISDNGKGSLKPLDRSLLFSFHQEIDPLNISFNNNNQE